MLPASIASSTTRASGARELGVAMRVTPTALEYSAVSDFALSDGGGGGVCTAISYAGGQSSTKVVFLNFDVASGLTQYRNYRAEANNTTAAYLGFSAEL